MINSYVALLRRLTFNYTDAILDESSYDVIDDFRVSSNRKEFTSDASRGSQNKNCQTSGSCESAATHENVTSGQDGGDGGGDIYIEFEEETTIANEDVIVSSSTEVVAMETKTKAAGHVTTQKGTSDVAGTSSPGFRTNVSASSLRSLPQTESEDPVGSDFSVHTRTRLLPTTHSQVSTTVDDGTMTSHSTATTSEEEEEKEATMTSSLDASSGRQASSTRTQTTLRKPFTTFVTPPSSPPAPPLTPTTNRGGGDVIIVVTGPFPPRDRQFEYSGSGGELGGERGRGWEREGGGGGDGGDLTVIRQRQKLRALNLGLIVGIVASVVLLVVLVVLSLCTARAVLGRRRRRSRTPLTTPGPAATGNEAGGPKASAVDDDEEEEGHRTVESSSKDDNLGCIPDTSASVAAAAGSADDLSGSKVKAPSDGAVKPKNVVEWYV